MRDANGDDLIVYEVRERAGCFGLFRRRRLRLCSGEPVKPVCDKAFEIAGTGEKLTRLGD